MNKDYSSYHVIEYKEIQYIFDPYAFGVGMWKVLTRNGKPGKTAERSLQLTLNRLFFGDAQLPNMVVRLNGATKKEKEKFADISISWLEKKVKGLKNNEQVEGSKPISSFTIGNLYFYLYNAKLKQTLPIWDKFPLTIPIQLFGDGFLGINLHYLSNSDRAKFLQYILNSSGYYSGSSIKIFQNFDSIKKLDMIKPCIKRYLFSQIVSRILPLEPHEWAHSIWLPVEEFMYNNRM